MGNDIEIRVRVANQTQTGVAAVRQSLTTALRGAATSVPVTVDDQTAAGTTQVRTALQQLRAQSPVRLDVQFNGDSTQITASAQAMQDLRQDTQRARTALTGLTTRATAAAAALGVLEQQAQGAARALHVLRHRAAAADATLRELGAGTTSASNSLRSLNTRAGTADGRLSTLADRARDLTGEMGDLGDGVDRVGASLGTLRGGFGRLTAAGSGAASAVGDGGGMGLRSQMIATAAVVGTALLPSLGALVPMLAGVAAVGGGAALAMDDLKKKAKELKGPFEEWKKAAEKAVAPHTERAVKSLKSAMKDLTPVIELGADTFGRITEKAAAFADSPAFKGALQKNAQMGAKFVEEFAGSLGTFTQSLLDFGAQSQPALDAWQNLLGGLLDTGLPGMFEGLEQGIGGSSDVLDGLASLINESLLPSLGKIAGSFAEAFGPLLKELLVGAGHAVELFGELFVGAMKVATPAAQAAADVFRGLNEIFEIGASVAGSLAKALGGAFVDTVAEFAGHEGKVNGLRGAFTSFSDWVKSNQAEIRVAFMMMGVAIIDMVNVGVQSVPLLIGAFRGLAETVLFNLDLMVSGLVAVFGDVPVIGDKLKEAKAQFDTFAGGFRDKLGGMEADAQRFADIADDKLGRAKLVLNVDQAKASLENIKEQLRDPALTKERRAKLTADKRAAEAGIESAKRRLSEFDKRRAAAKLDAEPSGFWGKIRSVIAARIPQKNGKVGANTGSFWSSVRGLNGRVVGTSYINVVQRAVNRIRALLPFGATGGPVSSLPRRADGGPVQHFPNGGSIEGPGGPRSDSILATFASGATARVSDTEYVVQSSAVKKYGMAFMDALNAGTLKVAGLAKGGSVAKRRQAARKKAAAARKKAAQAERQARNAAVGDLTISHFGRRAGYRNTEIVGALGAPDSLGELVSALNKWRSTIQKATHGGLERSLLRRLEGAGRALLKYEKQHDKLSATLEKARALRDSVASGLRGEAGIVKAANGDDSRVTINTLLSQMTASAANTKQFSGMLASLRKRGLSGGLIKQIAEAGISGGGMETAAAVLGGGPGEIKRLNALNAQISSSAKAAGNAAADAMYGAGMKAGAGLIAGLEKQEKAIEKQMMKIAKSMEKAIKRALGIKSPSKVMEPVGEFSAQGVEVGWEKRLAKGRTMLSGKTPAWASILNQPRTAPAATAGRAGVAAGPGAGMPPIVLNVSLAGREFGQIWVDVGRKEVKTRGGLKATLGGLT